jgi:predicted phage tail protein
MAKTRKLRGGAIPLFKNAIPDDLKKLTRVNARDFILEVCKELPTKYASLFKKEKGCVNNLCPKTMTHFQQQWAAAETDFKTQCIRAQALRRFTNLKNVADAAKLEPAYMKTTADRLIQNNKGAKNATAGTVKAAANATAKAAANAASATAKTAANAKAKAAANATAKVAANAKDKAAAAKAAANAAAAKAKAAAEAAKLTEAQKYVIKPPTTLPPPPPPATPSTGAAAQAYLSSSSSLEQKVENVSKKLERASQLLKSMSAPKSGGGYTRRRRN